MKLIPLARPSLWGLLLLCLCSRAEATGNRSSRGHTGTGGCQTQPDQSPAPEGLIKAEGHDPAARCRVQPQQQEAETRRNRKTTWRKWIFIVWLSETFNRYLCRDALKRVWHHLSESWIWFFLHDVSETCTTLWTFSPTRGRRVHWLYYSRGARSNKIQKYFIQNLTQVKYHQQQFYWKYLK